jgi:hypothetical protein
VGDLLAFGTVGEWQGSGWVVAGERHGMCESAQMDINAKRAESTDRDEEWKRATTEIN